MRYFGVFWTVGQKEAILLEQEQAEAVKVVGRGDRNSSAFGLKAFVYLRGVSVQQVYVI